jgi:hypothetical protein
MGQAMVDLLPGKHHSHTLPTISSCIIIIIIIFFTITINDIVVVVVIVVIIIIISSSRSISSIWPGAVPSKTWSFPTGCIPLDLQQLCLWAIRRSMPIRTIPCTEQGAIHAPTNPVLLPLIDRKLDDDGSHFAMR